jgi:nucleotidyltransferase substrate binding protein (TIGR01987 family)
LFSHLLHAGATMNIANSDIRWKQRFSNYQKVLSQLQEFIIKKDLSKLELQGLIKAFEYTYELSWNTIKDFYEAQGETNIQGSKDAFRLAFKRGLLDSGDTWMDMIESRKLTVHSYDEVVAKKVVDLIFKNYSEQFLKLETKLNSIE